MKRKLTAALVDWKQTSRGRKALLVEGARRVGKSYLVNDFAQSNYSSVISIDFSTADATIQDLFWHYLDRLDAFFTLISNYYQTPLFQRQTLFIFDEVQHFPRAREAIKHLVADGRYDYIETGSLISIKENVKDILIPSEERHITLRPMDFEEFLWATNQKMLADFIRQRFSERQPVTAGLHRQLMMAFRQYLIVGGMPQAVACFLQDQDFTRVDEQKREILSLYSDDMNKFSGRLGLKVARVFDAIPSQLQRHENKFNFAAIDENARLREYEEAFFWLQDAGLINQAYNVTEPNIGLHLMRDERYFKTFLFDTGLLLSMIFDEREIMKQEIYKKILFDKLAFNQGMIMENMVAQMLRAGGNKLYFYVRHDRENNENHMEIDFLLQKGIVTSKHNIIPLEVKTGKRYTYRSLGKFQAKYADFLAQPVIIHNQDLKVENGVLYLPVYMTELL